jgi:hypothetical protein
LRFRKWLIGFENMTEVQRKFLKRAIKDGLRIQHRFAAEPVLARTGKGYLKSEGVATLQRIKANLKNRSRNNYPSKTAVAAA